MKSIITALFLAVSTPAFAQPSCGDHTLTVEKLQETHGEVLRSSGIDVNGNLVEVFANASNGNWTVLVTPPDGLTCIVSSGSDYTSEPYGERT